MDAFIFHYSFVYWKEFEAIRSRLFVNLTQEEIEEAFYLAMSWGAKKKAATYTRMIGNSMIRRVSDRPDPQDANERIYGPGTYEGNRGILRSEYERQQRELQAFSSKLEDLKIEAELKKWDSIREKIEALEGKRGDLRWEALKDLAQAVAGAMGAGTTILSCPPAAFISAFLAVDAFKESAERYNQSCNVEKEIQGLLDLERSLEKNREVYGSGREK